MTAEGTLTCVPLQLYGSVRPSTLTINLRGPRNGVPVLSLVLTNDFSITFEINQIQWRVGEVGDWWGVKTWGCSPTFRGDSTPLSLSSGLPGCVCLGAVKSTVGFGAKFR